MTAPFTDAAWTEVQIRVAYQLVKLDYRHRPGRYTIPADGLYLLAQEQKQLGLGQLSSFLLAWAAMLDNRKALSKIVLAAIQRAREGHTWRRCAYPLYKETRRSNPRVTNRGVRVEVSPDAVTIEYGEYTRLGDGH